MAIQHPSEAAAALAGARGGTRTAIESRAGRVTLATGHITPGHGGTAPQHAHGGTAQRRHPAAHFDDTAPARGIVTEVARAPAAGEAVWQRALLLNATYEPLAIISWQRAITLVLLGKVEAIHEHDRKLHAARGAWSAPSIVRLKNYARQQFQPLRFTRPNVYLRDGHACVYCRKPFPSRELTWDHVIPRAQGGPTDWTNIVTACVKCNAKKGDRTPEQAGLTLARKPVKPTLPHALRLALGLRDTPPEWRDYLFFS